MSGEPSGYVIPVTLRDLFPKEAARDQLIKALAPSITRWEGGITCEYLDTVRTYQVPVYSCIKIA